MTPNTELEQVEIVITQPVHARCILYMWKDGWAQLTLTGYIDDGEEGGGEEMGYTCQYWTAGHDVC